MPHPYASLDRPPVLRQLASQGIGNARRATMQKRAKDVITLQELMGAYVVALVLTGLFVYYIFFGTK
jgi:hypothetical protein